MSPVVPDVRLRGQRKADNQSRCLVMPLRLKTFVRLQTFNAGQFVKEMEKLSVPLRGILPQTFTVPTFTVPLSGPVGAPSAITQENPRLEHTETCTSLENTV